MNNVKFSRKVRLIFLGTVFALLIGSSQSALILVPTNYASIQSAIDAAIPGDTIEVQSGTYYENVEVNKQLTLRGIDTGSELPVVDGGGSGSGITVSADGCTIEGFEVKNFASREYAGIKVLSDNNFIRGNKVVGDDTIRDDNLYYGIHISDSENNLLKENIISKVNFTGIRLSSSHFNTIDGNIVTYSDYGVDIGRLSMHNTVSNNTLSNNAYGIDIVGVTSEYTHKTYNIVRNNKLCYNNHGIWVGNVFNSSIEGNDICHNSLHGILVTWSKGNTIAHNNIYNSTKGVYLGTTWENTIKENDIWDNDYGIYFDPAVSTTIENNTIRENKINGIFVSPRSNDNVIFLNSFISNGINAISKEPMNYWNSNLPRTYEYNGITFVNYTGNFWSDYEGADNNNDGIGDTPYIFESQQDNHPMLMESGEPNIIVTKSADINSGSPSTDIHFIIEVTNNGDVVLDSVELEENLPIGLNYVSSDIEPSSQTESLIVWDLGELAPSDSTIINLVAHINGDAYGDLTNSVKAIGTDSQGTIVDAIDEEVVTAYKAAIDATKILSSESPDSGDFSTEATFSITVDNTGEVPLDVTLEDALPIGLDYVSAGVEPSSQVGNLITWNLGMIAPDDPPISFDLVVRINGDAYGTLTNSITANGIPLTGDGVADTDSEEIIAIMGVNVDVKPGSCPNPLNPKSKGVLTVAILGIEDFDVTNIDPATIEASREGAGTVSPLRWNVEDVGTPFEGELCDCHEKGTDGYPDLMLKFDMEELVETLNLADEAGETVTLTLTGELTEGTPFIGQDCIKVLKQGNKQTMAILPQQVFQVTKTHSPQKPTKPSKQ